MLRTRREPRDGRVMLIGENGKVTATVGGY